MAALVFAFLLGSYGFSLLWLVVPVALRVWSEQRHQARVERILRNELLMALESETAMRAFFDDAKISTWLAMPDVIRLDWLNQIIQRLWPLVRGELNAVVRKRIERTLTVRRDGTKTSGMVSSFVLSALDVGEVPPVFTGTQF